ncbi:MAG: hypothetical protein V1810_01180 [Candidatus Beckwithbacteria bacterium]
MEYFFKHNSFTGLDGNEILPTTLIYIFIPRLLAGWKNLSYISYLSAATLVNLLVIFLTLVVVKKKSSSLQSWLFLILVLAIGPILLFRFDTIVALFVLLSLYLFSKKRIISSAIFLSLATSMKIYPIILLPYLGLILMYQKSFKRILIYLFYFLLFMALPIIIFFLLGGNLKQILSAMEFHGLKYVSIESLPGSLLTASSLIFNHRPPDLLGGYGIWGITTPLIKTLGLKVFNYFWVLPVSFFYLFIIKNRKYLAKLYPSVCFSLVLFFLVFSKNLHPQYIWWFLSIFPFIKITAFNRYKYLFMFILLVFISIFNQLVYPLFYTQFIDDFFQHNRYYEVFYALLIRNFLIVCLLIVSLKNEFPKKTL